MNRIEGDLTIKLETDGDLITDALSSGAMYRGFENIMKGRGALDGLVITPRICGICTTAQLFAAAKALDMISGASVPDNAVRIRNATLMVEMIQNDLRQPLLLFMPDFTNPTYIGRSWFDEAVNRYEPLKGKSAIAAVVETKKILEIIAILGGQWPHSSFMVPGGVVSMPSQSEITKCRSLLSHFRNWFEKHITGCSLERFAEIKSLDMLMEWVDEKPEHRDSEIGFFIRLALDAGLDAIGNSHENYISFGSLELPKDTGISPLSDTHFLPPGFMTKGKVAPMNQRMITEDISHSWYEGYDNGRHPVEGVTRPYATGSEGKKYSWAKAPRYEGLPAETGPLAEMVIAGDPLITDILDKKGSSVFVRELTRLLRPVHIMPVLDAWLFETSTETSSFFNDTEKIQDGVGFGMIEAPRGGLGHWVKIKNERIEKYQIITPTCWNASPKDTDNVRGPWEEALVGTTIKDPENPVEVDHIVRSFDPCLACTVHTINGANPVRIV